MGLDWPWVTHAILGPFGVVLLLGLRCVPFSYLAITAALAGLGQEFEDAAPGARREPGPGLAAWSSRSWLRPSGPRWRSVSRSRSVTSGWPPRWPALRTSRWPLPAVRRDRELPSRPTPPRRGHGLAAGRRGGDPAGAASQGAARPERTLVLAAQLTSQPLTRRNTVRPGTYCRWRGW